MDYTGRAMRFFPVLALLRMAANSDHDTRVTRNYVLSFFFE